MARTSAGGLSPLLTELPGGVHVSKQVLAEHSTLVSCRVLFTLRTVRIAACIAALAPASAIAAAQGERIQVAVDSVSLSDRMRCARCRIVLDTLATLGDSLSERGLPSRPYDIARTVVGEYIAVFPERGEEAPLIFGRDGRFLRRLGRVGDGPGEYRRPAAVEVSGDTIFVFDGQAARMTVLDGRGRLLWTAPLPLAVNSAARVGKDRIAVNARVRDSERIGKPLHVFDDRGNYVISLTSERLRVDPRLVTNDVRWLSPVPRGGLLAVDYAHRYRAEVWSADLRRVRVFRRSPKWFREFDRPWDATPTKAPMPRSMGGWVAGHRLWLVFHVPSPTWSRGLGTAKRGEGGGTYYPVDNQQLVYRTILEVIDLRDHSLVASFELPGTIDVVMGGGLVGLLRQSSLGELVLAVVRISLDAPREEE